MLATSALGRVTRLLIFVPLVACYSKNSTEPLDPYADISGRWTILMSGFPGGTTGPEDGICRFDPVSFEITRVNPERLGDYEGQHAGFQMTCSGITEEATALSGIRDTVVG